MRHIMSTENFGVARVTGLGNKLGLDGTDVLEYYAQDPETKAVCIYIEDFKRPREFMETAAKMTPHKPVILLKGGATAEGANAAVAHTAAMASDDRITDGALRQAGIVRIYEYSHLILAAKALSGMPVPQGKRVSFMAPSGAMLVCLSDYCTKHCGLEIAPIEEKTRERLQNMSPPFIRMRNPVDIWPAVSVKGLETAYFEGTKTVLDDPNVDAAVMVLMLTDETGIPPLDFIVELAKTYPAKPLYVTYSGQKHHGEAAASFLEPRGIPVFPVLEQPFDALGIVSRCMKKDM
jgi:acyl-CoA synthetase (NDP forming)